MPADDREIGVQRLRVALDLFESGVDLMRQNLRRRHPDAGDAEIEAKLDEWLSERPGAECGDAEGTPGTWPRARR
jgi:hypothetical protein